MRHPRVPASTARRSLVAGLALGALGALWPAVALADPAGPTDYRSEVVAVIPDTGVVHADIVGGDSFVELTVTPGVEVVVLGYEAEPYLRFSADGGVYENRRSPATYLNRERYGAEVDELADAAAQPEWVRLGPGHEWAWHDHRAHRMETFAPLNAERGDRILDARIPLLVDGEPTEIGIVGTWMPAPSPVPMVIGVLAGLTAGAIGLLRSWRAAALLLGAVAAAATVIGAVQFGSLPAATDPRWSWWVMPALATVFALVGAWLGRPAVRHGAAAFYAPGLVGLAAVQLLVWGFERRDGLVRALLPTPAPFWLDRLVSAAALGAGASALVVVALEYRRRLSAATAASATPNPRHP